MSLGLGLTLAGVGSARSRRGLASANVAPAGLGESTSGLTSVVPAGRGLASFFPQEREQKETEARLNTQIKTLVASPKTKKPIYFSSVFFFCPDCFVLDSLSRKGDFILCRGCLGVWKLRGTDIVDLAQDAVDPTAAATTIATTAATTVATAKETASKPKSTITLSDVFEWQLRFLASFIKERSSRTEQGGSRTESESSRTEGKTFHPEKRNSQKKCIFYDSDIALRMLHTKPKSVHNQHVLCMLHSDALYFQEEQQAKQPHDISQDASTILPVRDIQAVHILHYHTLLIQTLDGTQLYLHKKKPESSLLKYFFALLSLLKK